MFTQSSLLFLSLLLFAGCSTPHQARLLTGTYQLSIEKDPNNSGYLILSENRNYYFINRSTHACEFASVEPYNEVSSFGTWKAEEKELQLKACYPNESWTNTLQRMKISQATNQVRLTPWQGGGWMENSSYMKITAPEFLKSAHIRDGNYSKEIHLE